MMHVIARGETLAGIARRYGVTVAAIATANGITDPNRITAGRSLTIPGATITQAPAAALVAGTVPAPVPVPVAAPASGSWLSQIVANIAPAAAAVEAAKYQRELNKLNLARLQAGQPIYPQTDAGDPYSVTNPEPTGPGGVPAWLLPAAGVAGVVWLLTRPATPHK